MISHLIKGRKNTLSSDSAVLLAKALEVDVTDLFVTELSQSPVQTASGRERKGRAA
jgi:hypothetical protein